MYRIYYGDGTYNKGKKRGVQAIVQPSKSVGWYVESHGDYYLLKDDGLWHAADFDGLFTELKKRGLIRPTIGLIHKVKVGRKWQEVNEMGFREWLESLDWLLFGETIDNDTFQKIFQKALADADFGRKCGYLAGERKP